MYKKYYHRKLIRDKIPQIVQSKGGKLKTIILKQTEFKKELKKKLLEESKEILHAPNKELVNELADVLELLKSIAQFYKIPFTRIEKYRMEKRKKRGGFNKKLYLVWSSQKKGK